MALLGLVALWRVALMARALTVLLDDYVSAATCLVLLVADVAVLAGLLLTAPGDKSGDEPPMLIGIMSGLFAGKPRSAARALVTRVTIIVAVVGVLSLPLWLAGLSRSLVSADTWRRLLAGPAPESGVGVWLLAAGVTAFFLALLP